MAGAAEIDRGDGVESLRIEDGGAALLDFAGFHGGDVRGAGAVAGFALDAGSELRDVEFFGGGGGGGVTAETAAGFVGVEPAAHGGFEIVGIVGDVAGGEVESLERFVEAQMGFVELAVAFVEVSLAFVADAEGPVDPSGKGLGAFGDGEFYVGGRGGEFVVEGGALVGEVAVGAEDGRVGGGRRGLRHRSGALRSGDLFVALRAFGGANEIGARSGAFGGPPRGGGVDAVVGGERNFGGGRGGF